MVHSPQVKWARWQAKQALLAFLRRGRSGSLALEALEGFGFCAGELAPEAWSVFCSAAMSLPSGSRLYSGEGDASSASGVVIISPLGYTGATARTGCVASVGGRCRRTFLLRAAVNVASYIPGVAGQPM